MTGTPPRVDNAAPASDDARQLDLDRMPMDIGVEEIEAAERLGWYVTTVTTSDGQSSDLAVKADLTGRITMTIDAGGEVAAERVRHTIGLYSPDGQPEPPPLFPCLMTDIETMSLHTGDAWLLSQGAIPFRLTPDGPVMGPPLLLVFDLLEQLLSTRHLDEKTRKFWRDQPAAARAHFADPAYVGYGGVTPVRITMADLAPRLAAFQARHCEPKNEVYSQGITFDLSNLTSAMAASGDEAPWQYWAATDARSLRRKLPKRREAPKLDIAGAPHDPVYDCVKQIWGLWEVATDEMLGVAPQAVAA